MRSLIFFPGFGILKGTRLRVPFCYQALRNHTGQWNV